MNNNYEIKDILSAVNSLLSDNKDIRQSKQNEEPLILKNEAKVSKKKSSNIPENTEKIILQAEKYIKK
tara:strand:- start:935 stop:1138 length:204 start_codon:yes stop_codon:yes gene_type:complete